MECLGKLQLDEIYECGPKKQLKAGELIAIATGPQDIHKHPKKALEKIIWPSV